MVTTRGIRNWANQLSRENTRFWIFIVVFKITRTEILETSSLRDERNQSCIYECFLIPVRTLVREKRYGGKKYLPGVTRSAMPRSRALVATSTIRRKPLRHHRNRCLFSSSSSSASSFLLACSKRPRQSRSFRYTAPISSDSGMRRFRVPFFSTASLSWRPYDRRQLVQVGWPEARIASWSVLLSESQFFYYTNGLASALISPFIDR